MWRWLVRLTSRSPCAWLRAISPRRRVPRCRHASSSAGFGLRKLCGAGRLKMSSLGFLQANVLLVRAKLDHVALFLCLQLQLQMIQPLAGIFRVGHLWIKLDDSLEGLFSRLIVAGRFDLEISQ